MGVDSLVVCDPLRTLCAELYGPGLEFCGGLVVSGCVEVFWLVAVVYLGIRHRSVQFGFWLCVYGFFSIL